MLIVVTGIAQTLDPSSVIHYRQEAVVRGLHHDL